MKAYIPLKEGEVKSIGDLYFNIVGLRLMEIGPEEIGEAIPRNLTFFRPIDIPEQGELVEILSNALRLILPYAKGYDTGGSREAKALHRKYIQIAMEALSRASKPEVEPKELDWKALAKKAVRERDNALAELDEKESFLISTLANNDKLKSELVSLKSKPALEWIPVSERMPTKEDGDWCGGLLHLLKHGAGGTCIHYGHWSQEKFSMPRLAFLPISFLPAYVPVEEKKLPDLEAWLAYEREVAGATFNPEYNTDTIKWAAEKGMEYAELLRKQNGGESNGN